MCKINVNYCNASLQELWRSEELDNHQGGVILTINNLYGSSTFKNRDQLVCMDWETGQNKFIDKVPASDNKANLYAEDLIVSKDNRYRINST